MFFHEIPNNSTSPVVEGKFSNVCPKILSYCNHCFKELITLSPRVNYFRPLRNLSTEFTGNNRTHSFHPIKTISSQKKRPVNCSFTRDFLVIDSELLSFTRDCLVIDNELLYWHVSEGYPNWGFRPNLEEGSTYNVKPVIPSWTINK